MSVRGAVVRTVVQPIRTFTSTEASGGVVLLAAAIVALAWANSPWDGAYNSLFGHRLALDGLVFHIDEDVRHWINDGLMTVFFFVAGLEIKRELQHGELASPDRAALPVIAALGGMIAPALIFTAFNLGGEGGHGWGIPMATDIAFALGVLALFGRRIPPPLRTFLLALAIADDIGAIIVIAIFYTNGLHVDSLLLAAALLGAVYAMRVAGVRSYVPYFVVGGAAWLATYESGVHATLAGVALGLLTPMGIEVTQGDEDSVLVSPGPLEDLQSFFHPVSSFLIVPLFALANAGVSLDPGTVRDSATTSVTLGVALGLLIGKPLGIVGASRLAVGVGLARLPRAVTWPHIIGVGFVAGIGFTVALFVNGVAFGEALQERARLGILAGSLAAALIGVLVLWWVTGRHARPAEVESPT